MRRRWERYLVLALVPGEEHAVATAEAFDLRECRHAAFRLAIQMQPRGAAPPVWRRAHKWVEHEDAPGRRPIGGYDCGNGCAAVAYLDGSQSGTRSDVSAMSERARRAWKKRRTYWRDPDRRGPASGRYRWENHLRHEARWVTNLALMEDELRARPTIRTGPLGALKVDTGRLRVWLLKGSASFNARIERKNDAGQWVDVTNEMIANYAK